LLGGHSFKIEFQSIPGGGARQNNQRRFSNLEDITSSHRTQNWMPNGVVDEAKLEPRQSSQKWFVISPKLERLTVTKMAKMENGGKSR
jgi:hypothetical protein